MKHYYDIALGPKGQPIPNPLITVWVAGTNQTTLATIYSDDGVTVKVNPFQGDALSNFDFYVADGRYDIQISAPQITTRIETDVEIADITQANTGDAPIVFGSMSVKNLENIRFADQFAGADMAAKIATAIADLPAGGGTVDARAFQGTQTCASNPFASVGVPVRVLLGAVSVQTSAPWNILNNNVSLIGSGWTQTSITYTGGATNQAFKVGTATPLVTALTGIAIKDLRISGNANTVDALFITAVHHSSFENLDLRNCTSAGLETQFAVVNTYKDIHCTNNNGAFTTQPAIGLLFGQIDASHQTTASAVIDPLIEGVSGSGIKLAGTEGMVFLAGTSENNNRGVEVTSANNRNTFDGIDLEANTVEDVLDGGVNTLFLNILSSGKLHFTGASPRVIGGNNNSYQIDAGVNNAYIDSSWNFSGTGTVLDNGTDTRMRLTNPASGSLQNTVSGSFGGGTGALTPGWSFRDVIPLTTIPSLGGMDRMDMLRGTFQFTTGGNIISTTPIASAVWRLLFVGLWSNNFEGGGLTQPAVIQEATAASPTLTIGTQVVTFTRNGSNQLVGTSTANIIGFSGTIYVTSSTVGAAGTSSALFKGSVIAPGLPQVIATGTSTLTANAALGAVTSQAAITTAATGVLTTDVVEWSYASAPGAGDSLCHVSAYPTAANVNFVRTNPTAAAQNVSAIVVNWRVIR